MKNLLKHFMKASNKFLAIAFFLLLISCTSKVIVQHKAPNFDSLLQVYLKEIPTPKYYDKNTPTIEVFATKDSVSFGFYCKNNYRETFVYHFYSKNSIFLLNKYKVEDTLLSEYTGRNGSYELVKKVFNKNIYFGYEENIGFMEVYAITKNDSAFIYCKSDTSEVEIFTKYNYLNEYFDNKKTYRKKCRQNDTGTVYRFFIHDVMGNIFRLYKSNGGIFIMRYGKENVKQNNEVIAAPYKQGIKYEYLDEKYKKEAKEFFYKPNNSFSIYQIDAETNMPFDSGAVYTSPWKYDWSRVDSLFYKHKL